MGIATASTSQFSCKQQNDTPDQNYQALKETVNALVEINKV